jgi:formylglycine-generating enzyme required for sulfatase activity
MTKRFLKAGGRIAVLGGLVLALFLGGCADPNGSDKSSDATLKSLGISSGTLSPAFSPETTDYTVAVGNEISSITLTAATNHAGASAQGDGPQTLGTGETSIAIIVIAEDGTATKTYTVTVLRASAVVSALDLTALVTAPTAGAVPDAMAIDTAQYTGTVEWRDADGTVFAGAVFVAGEAYQAAISLTATTGYTFAGVAQDSFYYAGATAANAADSGNVAITFPPAGSLAEEALNLSALVTAPAAGAVPDATAIDTAQYTGTVEWRNVDGTVFAGAVFVAGEAYQAVISLTAKTGYTFAGVAQDSFRYDGATVTNAAGSGAIAIVFPITGSVTGNALNLTALVTAPVAGAVPYTTAIDTAQYTGTVEWRNADGTAFNGASFAGGTVYRATVTLTAKPGYTFAGVGANKFTYAGAASVANAAGSGTVAIVFPATGSLAVNALDLSGLVTAPAKDAAPDTAAIDASQYTGTIAWQTADGKAFDGANFTGGTVYRATVTLTAKPGYTFAGVARDSFQYAGATVTNATNSGTVAIVFPATGSVAVSALDLDSLVTAPSAGAAPNTAAISTTQYTGSIVWQTQNGTAFTSSTFAGGTVYRAAVTLAATTGYTFAGVAQDSFRYAGATAANEADSGAVVITFPATATITVNALNLSSLVIAPVANAAPNVAAINTIQYTGTVEWLDDGGTAFAGAAFAAGTVYQAAVSLTAKTGYTFTGVAANNFTYTGATTVSNQANSGNVTIVFPAPSAAMVSDLDLSGLITAPVAGAAPNTAAISTTQYTGSIVWQTQSGAAFTGATFAGGTVYRAVASLTVTTGYSFTGVAANSFAHTGATTVTNSANSGSVILVFPVTESITVDALDLTALVVIPQALASPNTAAINQSQYTGTVAWQTADGTALSGGTSFAANTVYQAVVSLTVKTGYTFGGVAADSFTHAGATLTTNAVNSGIVTMVFPATGASGGGYVFATPDQHRAMAQVNSAYLTITGTGTNGAFIKDRIVTLSPYKIAKYETTWQLWKEVYDWATSEDRGPNRYTFANPGLEGHGTTGTGTLPEEKRITRPVTAVNWRDAIVWCNAYSEMSGLTPVYYTDAACTATLRTSTNDEGTATAADTAVIKTGAGGYRLPTEAQWEAAARGGDPSNTTNWNYTYAGGSSISNVSWYMANAYVGATVANRGAQPVGTKAGNLLGLYDMNGNAQEWVWDWYDAISAETVTDPEGPATGTAREMRGGGWYTAAAGVVHRMQNEPSAKLYSGAGANSYLGFRVAQAGN